MIRLLKIEFIKILSNKTVWIILGIYFILFGMFSFWMEDMLLSSVNDASKGNEYATSIAESLKVFEFPYIWHTFAYFAGWFKLILALIIIVLITNEFSFNTLRQNIIDGLSFKEAVGSKVIVIFLTSLVAVIFLSIIAISLGESTEVANLTNGSEFALAYFIEIFTFLSLTYFLSMLTKKTGLSIATLVLYIVFEYLIGFKLPEEVVPFLPVHALDNLVSMPFSIEINDTSTSINQDIDSGLTLTSGVTCLSYCALFISLSFLFLTRRRVGK